MKAYEKDKRFLETEKEQCIPFHQTSPMPNTSVKNTNENLESTSNKTCHSGEQACMSKQVIEKLTKLTSNLESPTNETSREKIQLKIKNLSKCHPTKFQILLLTKGPKFCPTTKGNVFDIKSDIKEFTRKVKLRDFGGMEYHDESLINSKSNINVNAAIPELSNISSILGQIEPTINDVNENLTKQERKALKELQEHKDLVIRKAVKGNAQVLMDKYNCDTLVMKHHLNASTYQKVDSNSDKRVVNILKLLIKKTRILFNKE